MFIYMCIGVYIHMYINVYTCIYMMHSISFQTFFLFTCVQIYWYNIAILGTI